MPTLIRLVVILLVLAGLAYGAMFGLVIMVTPKEKEVTVRIPARDLLPAPDRNPLVQREIDTSRPVEPGAPAGDAPPAEAAPAGETPAAPEPAPENPAPQGGGAAAAEEGSIITLSPGVE